MVHLAVRFGALPVTTDDGHSMALCYVMSRGKLLWLGLVPLGD